MSKTIEQKYQEMDEVSHILNRPGMYVGSTKEEEKDMLVLNELMSVCSMSNDSFVVFWNILSPASLSELINDSLPRFTMYVKSAVPICNVLLSSSVHEVPIYA